MTPTDRPDSERDEFARLLDHVTLMESQPARVTAAARVLAAFDAAHTPPVQPEAVVWQAFDSSQGWQSVTKDSYDHYAKFGATRRALVAIETHDPAGNLATKGQS